MKRHLIPLTIICATFAGIALTHADEAATQPTTLPSASVTWDKAKDHVNETVSVTGPVIGFHAFDNGAIVLNIGKDYPDPDRITVYLPGDEQTNMPDDHYVSKTITATGKLILFHNVPEIKCGTKDIQIAPTAAAPATAP
jgi:hypothetical protein